MTSYCQYTPDKKEQSTQNQTKICAIIVFYVYFVLYIELLFGDVGLNGSLNVFFVDLNSEISLENVYNKYAQQHYAMYIGNINYNNKLAYNANTTYVFISNWGMVALVLNESKVIHYDTATKTWKY